jgi:hypothetical protein
MDTDTNIAANAEPGVQTEDFAERVRVKQTKLTEIGSSRLNRIRI